MRAMLARLMLIGLLTGIIVGGTAIGVACGLTAAHWVDDDAITEKIIATPGSNVRLSCRQGSCRFCFTPGQLKVVENYACGVQGFAAAAGGSLATSLLTAVSVWALALYFSRRGGDAEPEDDTPAPASR